MNLSSQARFGSIISYVIQRADGTIEQPHGPVHNVLSQAWISVTNRWNNSGTWTARSYNTKVRTTLTGTFSQSGTTITRVTGSDTLFSGVRLYVWPGGNYTNSISGNASTATVFPALTKAAQSLDYIDWARSVSTDLMQSVTMSSAVVPTYSNGVLETYETSPMMFPPATTAYTLQRLAIARNFPNPNYPLWYDLPSPVSINVGDVIIITSFRLTFTWDSHAPRNLAVSPLTGITSSCKYQRTLSVTDDPVFANIDRVWILTTPNKMTLPNMGTVTPTTAGLTIAQTITPRATVDGSISTIVTMGAATNWSSIQDFFFTTASSQSDVKQIMWGRSTGNVIHGILEFDTPQTLAVNKAVRIREELAINLEL